MRTRAALSADERVRSDWNVLSAIAVTSSVFVLVTAVNPPVAKCATPPPGPPAIAINPTPLTEDTKTFKATPQPIDHAKQSLAACVGKDLGGGSGFAWKALQPPKATSKDEFEVAADDDGFRPETKLRVCVVNNGEDAQKACAAGTSDTVCRDVLVFPLLRGPLVSGDSSFTLSLPSGPWMNAARIASVTLTRDGRTYALTPSYFSSLLTLPSASPVPVTPLRQRINVGDFKVGDPTQPLSPGIEGKLLLAGDSLSVVIEPIDPPAATVALTAVVPQIIRAEMTLGRKAVKVAFRVPAGATVTAPIIELSAPNAHPYVVTDDEAKKGEATVKLLSAPLQVVDVTLQIKDPKTKQPLGTDSKQADAVPSTPTISVPLKDGMDTVSGSVAPGFTDVEVRLWKSTASLDDGGATCASPADPVACRVADLVQVGTITTTQKSTFSFKFARPLAAGEIVEVCPVEEDSSPLHAMNSSCARSMVQRLGWGPVTAQFTLGTLFSQKNSETSGTLDKVSAYAALNVSNSWFELKRCGGCPGSTSGGREKRGLAYTLQTFFEARLTQAGTSGENPADLASNLVISKTSGLFQTGAFFPWMVNSPEAYKLFVAPLGKIGFQAIPDGYALKYKTTTDASGKTVVQTDASGSPTVDEKSTIAPLWAAGVRFGLIELACRRPGSGGSDSSRRASGRQCRPARLISYLDVLWGQFDNYRVADPAAGSTSSPGRLAVEGRLAAPDLPFELGFDVNLRAGHPSQKPHDYRVFVALRWDAGRALRKLFGSSIPASDSSQQ